MSFNHATAAVPSVARAERVAGSLPAGVEGRRAAIAALFQSHFDLIARYIYVRTGDRHEAEDLASEVFIRALRSIDRYKDQGAPVEAWLFRIAHNLMVDHLRKRGRRPGAISLDGVRSVASSDNPAEVAIRNVQMDEVWRAVAQLTEAQQTVLELRFAAGLNSEEIAQVLGKRPGAVREVQSAALKRLRRLLPDFTYAG